MKSDKSRDTFHPEKHFSSVRLQQGRVLTDADWNEQSDVIEHRDETTTLDVIGQAGVPAASNGFQITPFVDGSDPLFPVNFRINGGRMYVDGILCELDHEFVNYTTQDDKFFDPAMAQSLAPHLPTPGDLSTMPLPELSPSGMVLVYADVWMRHIGVVEDPSIRETALGGPDTATRAKTVVQVKVINLPDADPPLTNADQLIAALNAGPVGRMEAQVDRVDDVNTPCIIPESAGFTRLENQLYRVEVHTAGEFVLDDSDNLVAVDGVFPTFKWSRDNGSILAEWLKDPQPEVGKLKVRLPTRDETRGFAAGEWVELTDDPRELSGVGGIFVKLISPTDQTTLTYDPTTIQDPLNVVQPPTGLPVRVPDEFHPKVRRWDMPADSGGPQQVNPFAGFVNLESGVQIRFPIEPGKYRVGDYWLIPARTINNTIEFPVGPQPPLGIRHHFTCLASFQVTSFETTLVDCRKLFNPLTDLNPASQDAPTPGQFRYYLIDQDGETNLQGDANGRVGIDNNSAAALAKAVPFLTVGKALSLFPRDGNGSIAVFLLRSGFGYGAFDVDGVHGYHKVVIRGAFFPADGAELNSLIEQLVSGALPQTFSCDVQNGTDPMNLIRISSASPLPGPPEAASAGQRVRFPSNTPTGSLADFTTMLLGVRTDSGHNEITITDILQERPSSSDSLFIERPNCFITRLSIGITDAPHPGSQDPALPSLSLVGLHVDQLICNGGVSGEIAFCQIGAAELGTFDQFDITGDFNDENDLLHRMGVGALVTASMNFRHGSFANLRNSALPSAEMEGVDDVRIDAGFVQGLILDHCGRFSIGAARGGNDPYRLRVGTERTGTAIRVNDSNGEVFSALLDSPVPVDGSGFETSFDFTNGNPSIELAGVNRSLRLDDLLLRQPANPGNNPTLVFQSGVILDAKGAVACTVSYDPGTIIPSGIFVLPQSALIRPFELTQTDVIDAANNHYLAPRLTYTQKGIAWQHATGTAFPRYSVMRLVTSSRFGVVQTSASAGLTANDIAGVSQQEFHPNSPNGASVHLTTGYSLVRLGGSVNSGITLPVSVVLNDADDGTVVATTTNPEAPQIQIGVLVRIIDFNDNHDLHDIGRGATHRLGLVKLDIRDLPPIVEG